MSPSPSFFVCFYVARGNDVVSHLQRTNPVQPVCGNWLPLGDFHGEVTTRQDRMPSIVSSKPERGPHSFSAILKSPKLRKAKGFVLCSLTYLAEKPGMNWCETLYNLYISLRCCCRHCRGFYVNVGYMFHISILRFFFFNLNQETYLAQGF